MPTPNRMSPYHFFSYFRALIVVTLLSFCGSGVSRGQGPAPPLDERKNIMDVVRRYGQDHHSSQATPPRQSVEQPASSAASPEGEQKNYHFHIVASLYDQKFDKLEQAAREARIGKARFQGGVWKLWEFYDAVDTPYMRQKATQGDWTAYFANLNKWMSAYPESPTPQVALAMGYINYAWKARGYGYSDTVDDASWDLFAKRIAKAKSTLIQAYQLKEKCPYWYEAMQAVAIAEGWDKSQARELLEQAVVFEPGYYHYYREYANFLLPKWYGEEGELEAFAEEASNRVDGQEGLFLYFEIASVGTCQCDSDKGTLSRLSWPKIKQGYAALDKLYGLTSLKNNRFAYMAYAADDRPAARQAFLLIGDGFDPSVWKSKHSFETAKAWASSP
jgi:uncharacterized protein DUF4034